MGATKHRNLEIRGVVYPTARAAAEAHGVTHSAILAAIRNGTLHRVGTGRTGVEPMPIRIRGEVFENAHLAAQRFGVRATAIYQAISQNRLDRIGLPLTFNGCGSKPFSVGNLNFASMAQASVALGFGRDYISQATRRKSKHAAARILAAAMKYEAQQAARVQRGKALRALVGVDRDAA